MLRRYVEGAGVAARFGIIEDIKFLTPTNLLCADSTNGCIRLIDIASNASETRRFAGECLSFEQTDGHRLQTARFRLPTHIEVDETNDVLFVLDIYTRVCNINNDIVTTMTQIYNHFAMLLSDDVLYFTWKKINTFDIKTGHKGDIGIPSGRTTGPFELTGFNDPRGMAQMLGESQPILVADVGNDRLLHYCYYTVFTLLLHFFH